MDSIIFDVDGTLWDSVDPVAESWNLAIAENTDMTPDLTRDSLAWLLAKTMTEIADALFPQIPLDERMRLLTICFDYENRYLETHPGKMYDGVVDTIRELSLRYPLFIVSNCQCGYIEVMMKSSGIEPYIKDHLCFGETRLSKDQTLLQLIEKNGLKSPVYVGDTQGDADSCSRAGIPFIFAEYGLGDVPDAKVRIARFEELLKIADK